MRIESYLLPSFWATALYYGDYSALDRQDVHDIGEWWRATFPRGVAVNCVSSDGPAVLTAHHDACAVTGRVMSECANFVFHIG